MTDAKLAFTTVDGLQGFYCQHIVSPVSHSMPIWLSVPLSAVFLATPGFHLCRECEHGEDTRLRLATAIRGCC